MTLVEGLASRPSQRSLAQGLGCLLTKPKTRVMVPILTLFNVVFHAQNIHLFADSLESANSSLLAVHRHFKEVVGEKSGFYDN